MLDLEKFFEEKDLQEVVWEIEGNNSLHILSNEIVIDFIMDLPEGKNKDKIRKNLSRIDFKNGNINNFLKHIAKWLVTA